jgi:hypothetical protein
MLKNQFLMQVMGSAVGAIQGELTSLHAEDKRHLLGSLEAGEEGNSDSLAEFLGKIKFDNTDNKKNKGQAETFAFSWNPPSKNKTSFSQLQKAKSTFKFVLMLRLVDGDSSAKWVDQLTITKATVQNVAADERDGHQAVTIGYGANSTDWDEDVTHEKNK